MHGCPAPRLVLALALLAATSLAVAAPRPGWADARPPRGVAVQQARFEYLARPPAASTGPAGPRSEPTPPPLIPLPPVRQHSDAACGPSCLASLFAFYGKPSLRGAQLTRRAHQTYADGTECRDMKRVAQEMGFRVHAAHGWSLAKLFDHVQQGTPVTIGYQAWPTHPERVDWRKTISEGHYSVVIGFGDREGNRYPSLAALRRDLPNAVVWMMDPAMDLGQRGWMPVKELLQRWHWAAPSQRGRGEHFGMALLTDAAPTNTCFVSGVGRIR